MTKRNFLAVIALVLGTVLCMFSVGCGGNDGESSSTGGGTSEHTHTLVKVGAKASTCKTAGNEEYYKCSGCEKLFADAEGKTETTADAVAKAKLAHDYRLEPATEPGKTTIGNEEHYFCAECGQNATKDADGNYVETDRTDWDVYYDYINEIVQGEKKMKNMDQFTNDTVVYREVEKDGKKVKAAYFSNNTPWENRQYDDNADNKWNWGFSEFRIALNEASITGISFDYKINGTTEGYCNMLDTTDKSHGMKHVIEYKSSKLSPAYKNVTRSEKGFGKEFLKMDNEWHTFTLDVAQDGMQNILLKLYHFQGEMWVTNYHVYFA